MYNISRDIILSIIIVCYNSEKYIEKCIEAIYKVIRTKYEVIVVDNNSSDGSVKILKKFKNIRLIELKNNFGFSKANNIALKYSRGEFILFLNDDTILLSDVENALNLLKRHRRIGIVGAKMLDKNKNYRYSAGYFPEPLRLFFIRTMLKKNGLFAHGSFLEDNGKTYYKVDYVEGSFILTQKKILKKTGGFDENYFMYGEDIELCYRLKIKGYETVYMPSIKYIHYGGYHHEREYLLVNGILLFHNKWSDKRKQRIVRVILTTRLVTKYLLSNFISKITNNKKYYTISEGSLKALRYNLHKKI